MSSYVVLARRWRPRTFAALVGQGHVTQALTHALTTGRIPHAFLFSGIRGVGKTTLARLLAMCLNCQQGVSAEPCGQCTSCQEIIAGNHPDVLEIDAASRTKVEQMREVLDMVSYSPAAARFKVYILDEIHMLSSQSFNALLKTLEEPPAHVKFIFATTESRKIPATILSRCQRYDLKRVSRDLLATHLQTVLQAEAVPFDPEAVAAVVRSAEGSVRDALSLLDQVIVHGAGTVRFAAVKELLGLTDPETILQLLAALLQGRGPEVLQRATDFYNNGVEPESLVKELLEVTHRSAQHKLLGASTTPLAGDLLPTLLAPLVADISLEHLQMVYQVLLRGSQDLRIAEDALQALEMLLLRVAYLKPVPSLEKLLANLNNKDKKLSAEARTKATPVVDKETVGESGQQLASWSQLVSFVASRDKGLAIKLEQLLACPLFETDAHGRPSLIELQLANEICGTAGEIQVLLSDFLTAQGMPGVRIAVRSVANGVREDTLGESAAHARQERQIQLTEKMKNHPVMQKIITHFQAELIRVEPIACANGPI